MPARRPDPPAVVWAAQARLGAEGWGVLQQIALRADETGYAEVPLSDLAHKFVSTERHMRDVVARLVLDGFCDRVGFPGKMGGFRLRVPFERTLIDGIPSANETSTRLIWHRNETPARPIQESNETSTRLIQPNETSTRLISRLIQDSNETSTRLIPDSLAPARVGSPTGNRDVSGLSVKDPEPLSAEAARAREPIPINGLSAAVGANGHASESRLPARPTLTDAERAQLHSTYGPKFAAIDREEDLERGLARWATSKRAAAYRDQFPLATSYLQSAADWLLGDLQHYVNPRPAGVVEPRSQPRRPSTSGGGFPKGIEVGAPGTL